MFKGHTYNEFHIKYEKNVISIRMIFLHLYDIDIEKKYKNLMEVRISLLYAVHICHNILKIATSCKIVHRQIERNKK